MLPADDLAADIDIAGGVDADGVGLIVRQRLDLLDPGLVAVGVVLGDKAVIVAVRD